MNNQLHEAALSEVTALLTAKGYQVASSAYHDVMPKDVQNILKMSDSATSLYIRTRSDRIAINNKMVFEFEVKTRVTGDGWDAFIEALPYFVHSQLAVTLGVGCIYFFSNPSKKQRRAWWAGEMPILEFRITDRYKNTLPTLVEKMTSLCGRMYPKCQISDGWGSNFGSDDPYLVMSCIEFNKMPTWEEMIETL